MSPAQFLQITDLLTDALLFVATDGDVLAVNRSGCALLGLATGAQPVGKLQEWVRGDPRALSRFLRQCARSREPILTTLTLSSDGQTRPFRCRGALLAPRTDDRAARVMLTLTPREVSNQPFRVLNEKLHQLGGEFERRKASEEAVRQHLKMSEFGRGIGLALAESGGVDEMLGRCTDLMVDHLGAAFARIWVLDETGEELVLRASSGLYTHLNGGHSRIALGQLKIGAIAATQQPHLTNQVIGDTRVDQQWAREERMVAFAGYPLVVDGVTIGVMALFAREELSELVLEAMASIASELAVGIRRKQTEKDLREKAAALELADARKNEFLAMLAHELRNPLAPIRSGLELLQSEGRDGEVLSLMQSQVEHMVRIIDDLLDMSRIMQGRIEIRQHPVDMNEIVSQCVAAIRPSADAAGQLLQERRAARPAWVNGDEVRLAQAILNLLNNAVKYTPSGGRIQTRCEVDGGDVVIKIEDNGIGIAPEFAPELFTLFAQAARGLDRAQGGLGIGLTLVKQIAILHGGTVGAHSDGLGTGSLFTIRLPRIKAPSSTGEVPDAEDGEDSPFRVMVVDDNKASAQILARLLEKNWQHEVVIEHEGFRAVQRAEQMHPDIVFLDIGLPGMSGFEVAATLRDNPRLAKTFLVALTGYGSDEDRRKSAQVGIHVHLVKPIGLDDLKLVFRMCKAARQL